MRAIELRAEAHDELRPLVVPKAVRARFSAVPEPDFRADAGGAAVEGGYRFEVL